MTDNVQDEIKNIVDQNDVVLFMKGTKGQPQCGFSNAVKNEFIGGCDIILDMHKSGELASVFDTKGITHD